MGKRFHGSFPQNDITGRADFVGNCHSPGRVDPIKADVYVPHINATFVGKPVTQDSIAYKGRAAIMNSSCPGKRGMRNPKNQPIMPTRLLALSQ